MHLNPIGGHEAHWIMCSSIQYFRRRWMSGDDAADDVRPLTSSHLEGVGCPRVVVQVIYSDSAPSESKKISESEWVE